MLLAPYPQPCHKRSATCQDGNRQFLIVNIIGSVISSKRILILIHTIICRYRKNQRSTESHNMATTVTSSLSLKPSPLALEKSSVVRGLPSLARTTSLRVEASAKKKLKTDKPYGVNGGMKLRDGLDASGRKPKGKGVYQFVDKYGANVDGYSPIYDENDWSPSGDVYVGGSTGLAIWAITLAGILAGGALLVYNTSALVQ